MTGPEGPVIQEAAKQVSLPGFAKVSIMTGPEGPVILRAQDIGSTDANSVSIMTGPEGPVIPFASPFHCRP